MRWRVHAQARKWEACLEIATTLTKVAPERRFGWLHRAQALRKLGRIQEAYDFLQQQRGRFEPNSTIPYFLACYACQLGRLLDAQNWLEHAMGIAAETGDERQLKLRAVDDPDLQPLWKEMGHHD